MPTLFTRIINGEIPGHFVWKDDDVVAFLSIGPLSDGHTLVVPREEINKWTDAPAELMQKLVTVAQTVGQAQVAVFGSERAGLTIAGFEVEHLHLARLACRLDAGLRLQPGRVQPGPRADGGKRGKAAPGPARRRTRAVRSRSLGFISGDVGPVPEA